MSIEHVNPPGLFHMPAFSQIVTGSGGRLAFIAGQTAFDKDFKLVGGSDLHAQTLQALANLRTALEAVGGGPEHVVSTTVYLVGISAEVVRGFSRAMKEALDGEPFPPNASTMVGVQGLAMEGMLVEISAIALIP